MAIAKNRVLYIGGFEMPDRNAAAQRVLSVSKALRELGYDVRFYGITKCEDLIGKTDGFDYEAYPHPEGIIAWFRYSLGGGIINFIKKKCPDYVFLYNYPSVAQERVIKYCRKHGIRTVGDITEWYRSFSLPKRIDTYLRMTVSNKHLDGIIAISRYLATYYHDHHVLLLPPLVDKEERKWSILPEKRQNDKINLVYIGTGSIKDRLDKIVSGLLNVGTDKFYLDVIGITEQQYTSIYKKENLHNDSIVFHGRLLHQEALRYLMRADFQIFFRDSIRVNNAGFPTKFVESMSAGIPVITNRISNIDDYIRNGENSFMIENPTENEIFGVLSRIASMSRAQIESMKQNCLKNEFDYRKYCPLIKSFMDRL